MTLFRTGNVIKIPVIGIVIVSRCTDDKVDWISFDHEGSSGTGKIKDHMRSQACFCLEQNEGEYDEHCEDCHGTGGYDVKVEGLDKAKLLAPNVKDYIMKSLTKNFEWQ